MGAGMGAQYGTTFSQVNQYGQLSQAQAGSQAGDFFGNTVTPVAVHGGMMAAMVAAPMMAGAQSLAPRMLGSTMMALEPFSYVAPAARAGFAFGGGGSWAAGRGALGAMKTAWGGFTGAKTAAGVGRASLSLGRAAMGVAGAGAVGLAAAAAPIAAGLAITEGMIQTGEQVFHGAHQGMVGKGLMASIGGQFGGNQHHGANVGKLLADQGRDIGKGVGQMADMVREMDSMKLFQTTRDVKEFKERFTKIMDTVKEVASTMQTSVDDALKMVGELRTQGFYTTSDIKAASLRQTAREIMSGLSTGDMVNAGRFGTQYARQLGMKGRHGSDFAQQQTAGVAYAMRQGYLSEEDVMEAGGVGQVGAGMAARQMRFLSSSRGRVMIANMLGEGNEMDMGRVNSFLSGDKSLESMVTGASNRGLGTLHRAGTAEARENAMQYAGMGMVSIAAAQSQQLHGGYNKQGIIRHLGTMGMGVNEANMMLSQTMAMPELLEAQASAEYEAAQTEAWEQDRNYHKIGASVSRYLNSGDYGFTRGLFSRARGWGEDMGGAASRSWGDVAETFWRPRTYSGGGESDQRLAERYGRGSGRDMDYERASEALLAKSAWWEKRYGQLEHVAPALEYGPVDQLMGVSTSDSGPLIGGTPGARERMRTELSAYTIGANEAIKKGGDHVDLGDGRFISREDMNRGLKISQSAKLTDRQRTNLSRLTGGGGDIVQRARETIVGGSDLGYDRLNDIYQAEGWDDLSKEEQNLWLLATASDTLSGDTKTGLRGSGDIEKYISDKNYRTLLTSTMRQDEKLVETGIAKKGTLRRLGTVSGVRETGEQNLNKLLSGLDNQSIYDGIDEDDISKTLSSDKDARAAFAKYLEAQKGGTPEEIAEAMQGLESYDQLHKIALKADSHVNYRMSLRQSAGGMLEELGVIADAEVRGRSQSRAVANAREAKGFAGGKYDKRLDQLGRSGTGISTYSEMTQRFIEDDLLSDSDLSDEEAALLETVYGASGGRLGSGLQGLLSGDATKTKAAGESLNFTEDEIKMIGSIQDETARAAQVIEILKQKNLLDPTAYSSASGTEIGDTRTAYAQANTRFVAAVDRFVSNMKGDLGDDWKPLDQNFLEGEGG